MSCEHAEQDGAYVLGALSPAERLDFERHLATCEECSRSVRELAGLPGLLARVDATVLEEPADAAAPPVPEALLMNLVREVRHERSRRRTLTGLLAAAAVAAITALGVGAVTGAFGHDPANPPAASVAGLRMTPLANAPVHATLALTSVSWGTKLDLACTYAPSAADVKTWGGTTAPTYTLVVRTKDGRTEQVGTWRSVEGRTMSVAAATAARRADIASVEVRTASGQPVLRLQG